MYLWVRGNHKQPTFRLTRTGSKWQEKHTDTRCFWIALVYLTKVPLDKRVAHTVLPIRIRISCPKIFLSVLILPWFGLPRYPWTRRNHIQPPFRLIRTRRSCQKYKKCFSFALVLLTKVPLDSCYHIQSSSLGSEEEPKNIPKCLSIYPGFGWPRYPWTRSNHIQPTFRLIRTRRSCQEYKAL